MGGLQPPGCRQGYHSGPDKTAALDRPQGSPRSLAVSLSKWVHQTSALRPSQGWSKLQTDYLVGGFSVGEHF